MVTNTSFPSSDRLDQHVTVTEAGIPATRILRVPVSTINIPIAVQIILGWNDRSESHYICVRDVHGIMRAQNDEDLMAIHHGAGMITPDGMPLVWIMRARGYKDSGRVCGADLVAALCDASQEPQTRHYFYGGKPGVADRMAEALLNSFPRLNVVGASTPPFGEVSSFESHAEIEKIVSANPSIVWVGLSTPKQEYWMRDHVGKIPGATLIGVGAAFDFYAGDVKRAPAWMHHSGLEWLHRLASEPRRLWKRYLVLAPKFVGLTFANYVTSKRRYRK